MNEENKIRPFLMGIVDGSLTNKFANELYKKVESSSVCKILMSNYLKDGSKLEDEACPESHSSSSCGSHMLHHHHGERKQARGKSHTDISHRFCPSERGRKYQGEGSKNLETNAEALRLRRHDGFQELQAQ